MSAFGAPAGALRNVGFQFANEGKRAFPKGSLSIVDRRECAPLIGAGIVRCTAGSAASKKDTWVGMKGLKNNMGDYIHYGGNS